MSISRAFHSLPVIVIMILTLGLAGPVPLYAQTAEPIAGSEGTMATTEPDNPAGSSVEAPTDEMFPESGALKTSDEGGKSEVETDYEILQKIVKMLQENPPKSEAEKDLEILQGIVKQIAEYEANKQSPTGPNEVIGSENDVMVTPNPDGTYDVTDQLGNVITVDKNGVLVPDAGISDGVPAEDESTMSVTDPAIEEMEGLVAELEAQTLTISDEPVDGAEEVVNDESAADSKEGLAPAVFTEPQETDAARRQRTALVDETRAALASVSNTAAADRNQLAGIADGIASRLVTYRQSPNWPTPQSNQTHLRTLTALSATVQRLQVYFSPSQPEDQLGGNATYDRGMQILRGIPENQFMRRNAVVQEILNCCADTMTIAQLSGLRNGSQQRADLYGRLANPNSVRATLRRAADLLDAIPQIRPPLTSE